MPATNTSAPRALVIIDLGVICGRLSNALVQLQAHLIIAREARIEKCLSAATFVRPRRTWARPVIRGQRRDLTGMEVRVVAEGIRFQVVAPGQSIPGAQELNRDETGAPRS